MSFENTQKLLDFIHFLDEGRWLAESNYDIPNYADTRMPPDQKLLTHFLGYITNRQISYKLIFSKLDFIFSQLVIDFYSHSPYTLLLNPGKYIYCEKGEKKGFQACRPMDDRAQYSEDKSLPRKELIRASSRFFPNDVVGIFCTLKVLAHFTEKNFSDYIKKSLSLATPEQWKNEDLDHQKIYDRCIVKKYDAIKKFYDGGGIPETFRKERYKSKRLTCFVRDLFKCEHYRSLFEKIISPQVMKKLQNQLYVLELPGDVWNNNEHFQECFRRCFKIEEPKRKTEQFNEIVRALYENQVWAELGLTRSDYYPEQLDTTFDFVPRMCEKTGRANCDICPLNPKGNGKISGKFCLKESDQEKFCPFLLYACGYKVSCKDVKTCPNKHLGNNIK